MEKYLVTSALPYANGPVHVGHLAGAYLPADIYVRFLRLLNKDVVFICGTDEHGVPITLAAEQRKIDPREYVREMHDLIRSAFDKAGILFDNFSGTARPNHYALSSEFFLTLNEKGYLERKAVKQLYCESCRRFLPDRYVEGTCPKCRKEGARGDQCEACGSDLDQTELVAPRCKLCGKTPVLRDSFHWFLKLSLFEKPLRDWLESKRADWKENVVNFCNGLLNEGLPDRAITRDMEWGIPVPLPEGKGKVIYVWFEAPIGYISSTAEWAKNIKGEPDLWKKYWHDPETRLVHFIGKDNIVFHSIMWPAVLMGAGSPLLPWRIPANEFLNLEGRKISTSRNFAIWVHEFLEVFSPDALRYYTASIAPEAKDSDFSLSEFQAANNGELADILGNFVNRVITFVHRYYEGAVPPLANGDPEAAWAAERIRSARAELEEAFAAFQVRKACQGLMNFCRDANKYFNDKAPWKSRKENPQACSSTLHACLMLIRALSLLGSPIIPFSCEKIRTVFPDSETLNWQTLDQTLPAGKKMGELPILFAKIENDAIEAYRCRL